MTSRFADPDSTILVDLGSCLCPDTPHESDWAKIKGEASASETLAFVRSAAADGLAEAAAPFIVEWNLLGNDGKPWPASEESVAALKSHTLAPLIAAINEMVEASGTLPNASGAPSAPSSRGSAHRTPKKTRPPTT